MPEPTTTTPTATNPTVADWQSALFGLAADFGKVASDNLRKQADKDAEQKRLESPSAPDWKKWVAIGVGVLVALVVVRKLFWK